MAKFSPADLPKLSAQRVKRSDGSYSCSIRSKDEYNRLVTVGHVRDKKEFGPIDFTPNFLEQYPQLKQLTVVRMEDRSITYLPKEAEPTKTTPAQQVRQTTKTASSKTKSASSKARPTKVQPANDQIVEPGNYFERSEFDVLLQEMLGQSILNEMDRKAGRTSEPRLGQGNALFGHDHAQEQVQQALAQLASEDNTKNLFQATNKKAERELTFGSDLANCPKLSKNSLQLFTVDLEEFSELKPTYLGQGEMADGEIPEHLVILTDPHTRCVRYFGPSPCAMTETQKFVAVADQVTNFITKARELKSSAVNQVKPLITYDQQLHDPATVEPLTAAGYDVLARLTNDSPLGTMAINAVINRKMHQGKGKKYPNLTNISHMAVPKAQCPVLSTGQTLNLHVFVMPQFFELPEAHVFSLADLEVPQRISAAQRPKLREQAFRKWCYVLATTTSLDVATMLNAYWERGTLIDELHDYQGELQSTLSEPIDGSTFMGSLFCMFQSHSVEVDMPDLHDMASMIFGQFNPF